MTTIEERSEYLNNPFKTDPLVGDYTPFYITIGICSAFLGTLLILNIVFCYCSRHKAYWQDRNTGNFWLVTLWTATPHKTPPLDLTELQDVASFQPIRSTDETEYVLSQRQEEPRQYGRHQLYHHHQAHHSQQPQHHQQEEYVELQKRESDI